MLAGLKYRDGNAPWAIDIVAVPCSDSHTSGSGCTCFGVIADEYVYIRRLVQSARIQAQEVGLERILFLCEYGVFQFIRYTRCNLPSYLLSDFLSG